MLQRLKPTLALAGGWIWCDLASVGGFEKRDGVMISWVYHHPRNSEHFSRLDPKPLQA